MSRTTAGPTTEAAQGTFGHIRRMRDSRFPHEIAAILPGEFFVSQTPMIVYTVLGSCISACIRDPITQVGGMNHFMLPEPRENAADTWGESTRYGSFAMESLINEILKRGGLKSRLEIKLFGAGKIYDVTESFLWMEGDHQGQHVAGKDLTDDMKLAPHGEEMLERVKLVGVLVSEPDK